MHAVPPSSPSAASSCGRIAVKQLLLDDSCLQSCALPPVVHMSPLLPARSRPNAVRLLPRLAPAPPSSSSSSSADASSLSESDVRRKKIELRKARNRESAQRSNFKRKLRLERLKKELELLSRHASLLRVKERHLRQENNSLKKTMSTSN